MVQPHLPEFSGSASSNDFEDSTEMRLIRKSSSQRQVTHVYFLLHQIVASKLNTQSVQVFTKSLSAARPKDPRHMDGMHTCILSDFFQCDRPRKGIAQHILYIKKPVRLPELKSDENHRRHVGTFP